MATICLFINIFLKLRTNHFRMNKFYNYADFSLYRKMKKYIVTALAVVSSVCAIAGEKPTSGVMFDVSKGVAGTVSMPNGIVVNYTAYTRLYYVTNVEDSTYQYMNVFVPDGANQSTPIFMPNYVGGYMAARPQSGNAGDASGRALAEGYVVAIPGVRGRNSVVTNAKGESVYTGRAPKALLDLKAAVRYLRHFDKEMPGDAEKIITNGTSAGGAMSSLLGATGNNPSYEDYLKEMGAADKRDDIFAAVCFCPIIDLDHADAAYEWLYGCTNNVTRHLTDEQAEVSKELATQYSDYLNSLHLKKTDGSPLSSDNYKDYIKELLIKSAQEAKDYGASIPDSIGFTFSGMPQFIAPLNGGMKGHSRHGLQQKRTAKNQGEYITDLDLERYLNYVVTKTPLKTPPAFDSKGVAGGKASGENEEFGDENGSSVNYTAYSIQKSTGDKDAQVDSSIKTAVKLMNPMNFITAPNTKVAQHWYIRHGAIDRDTAFSVPINLATRLQNEGKDVNFKLAWNRPHSGDYALNEMFEWIKRILNSDI